jgi:hypothetical protein
MPEQGFVNDPTILDGDDLFRRVHPKHIVADEKSDGGFRLSTAAFTPIELSVDVAKETTPARCLDKYPEHSLVAFSAGLARSVDQIVTHAPEPDNTAHALVVGKKGNPTKRVLRDGSRWIVFKKT